MGTTAAEIGPATLATRLERVGMEDVSTRVTLNEPTLSFDIPATAFTGLEKAATGSAVVFTDDGSFDQFIMRLPRLPMGQYDAVTTTDELEQMIEAVGLPRPWLLRLTERAGLGWIDPHIKKWTDPDRKPRPLHGRLDDPTVRFQDAPDGADLSMTATEAGEMIVELTEGFYETVDQPFFG